MKSNSIYFKLFQTVMESGFYTGLLALFMSLVLSAIFGEPWLILLTGLVMVPLVGYQSVVLLLSSRGMYQKLVYQNTMDLFDRLLPMVLLLVTVPIALVLLAFTNSPGDIPVWLLALSCGLCVAYMHTWLFARAFMTRFSENNPEF